MTNRQIINQYHVWLTTLVSDEHHQRNYQALFEMLDDTEFVPLVKNDANRAANGIDLRSRFAEVHNLDYSKIRIVLLRPCSVLEMMVGLACRCEDSIMGDELYGDRTDIWFWGMIENLGLYNMTDENFDELEVHAILDRLINRTYSRNGEGGLFTVPGCYRDLRKVEIWYQMNWYLNTIK